MGAAALTVAQPEAPRTRPAEKPRWVQELPNRALPASVPRMESSAAVLPILPSLPPAAESRMKTMRSAAPASKEAAPGPSRAPPLA